MNPFKPHAKTEMLVSPGLLRVSVRPSQNSAALLVQAATIVVTALWLFVEKSRMSWLEFLFASLSVLGAMVAWFGLLFAWEEVIEFDARQIRIRNEVFCWERNREYPIAECADLKPQDLFGSPHGLQCRLGRRTIEFGNVLSKEQAFEVIAALEDSLPEVVPTLLPSIDISEDLMKA